MSVWLLDIFFTSIMSVPFSLNDSCGLCVMLDLFKVYAFLPAVRWCIISHKSHWQFDTKKQINNHVLFVFFCFYLKWYECVKVCEVCYRFVHTVACGFINYAVQIINDIFRQLAVKNSSQANDTEQKLPRQWHHGEEFLH